MPIKLETNTKIIGKNLYIDNEKKNLRMDIGGMDKPQIIIREGQNFTIVKETKNKDDEKNIGVIKTQKIDGLEIDVRNNINEFLKYKQLPFTHEPSTEASIPDSSMSPVNLGIQIIRSKPTNPESVTLSNLYNRKCNDTLVKDLINVDNIFEIYNNSMNVNFSKDVNKIVNEDRIDFIEFNKDDEYDRQDEYDSRNKSIGNDLLFPCKKKLYDVSTEFFTNQVFQNQETIFTFQFFVNKFFNDVITKYKKDNSLNDTDIIFLFKGGTTMMILFNTYHKYFPDNDDNEYKKFFKRSDSDYQLYLNPNIKNAQLHRKNIIKLLHITLYNIRGILESCNDTFFDFNNNEEKLKELITEYNKEIIKNTTVDISGKIPECKELLDDIKVIGVLFKDKLVFENDTIKNDFFDKTRKYTPLNVDEIFNPNKSKYFESKLNELQTEGGKRNDFYLSNNKLFFFNNDYKYENKKKDIFLSLNDDITKNKNPIHKRLFSLLRIKYNFVIFYKRNNKYGTLNVPAELIDLSISKLDDTDMIHSYINIKQYIYKYSFDKYLTLDYFGYSIDGYICDFTNALFNENNNPWNDPKYTKKISRISYFMMLYLLLSNKTVDIKINILDDLIVVFSIAYDRMNLSNINTLINKIKEKYDDDNTLIYFLNGLEKIYQKNISYGQISDIPDVTQYIIDNIKLYEDFTQTMIKYLNINKTIINKYKKINTEQIVSQLGGYYVKYLKYKQKYIELKNKILS
jgi:hypothetical protein